MSAYTGVWVIFFHTWHTLVGYAIVRQGLYAWVESRRVISLFGRVGEWLHSSRVNGYTNRMVNQKVNKNALQISLQVDTCISASLITFYFFGLFQYSSQPIQLQYCSWIYPEQVACGWVGPIVIYGRNQQVESDRVKSFEAVDSTRFPIFCASSRIESESMTRLVTTLQLASLLWCA
jgi:hypothetical protein